jgi:membrane protein
MPVTWQGLKRALIATYNGVVQNHMLHLAAALSYYLVLSVFPALILFFALVASIPVHDLLGDVMALMSRLLPSETVRMVQTVLLDVLGTNRTAWLSFGTIGTIWVVSTAFDAIIEALDVAYDVKKRRPFWKTRLIAVVLAAITGGLFLSALAVMIVGPRFGAWLAIRITLSRGFVSLWPFLHWIVVVVSTLLAVELLYFLAPNVKQRFLATLPGAILAVLCWIGLSYLLGFYFRHVADFSRTYGTLAGFIAFMIWFYWNSFALLVGAELNAELAKESSAGALAQAE